jgi:hydroxymethylbilane synthase
LCIAATPRRASADDVCILLRASCDALPEASDTVETDGAATAHHRHWTFLPEGARIGTSSLRRRAQLLHFRPDLQVQDIRGNIDTRLRKLEAQDFDASSWPRPACSGWVLTEAASILRCSRWASALLYRRRGQGALCDRSAQRRCTVIELLRALEDEPTRHEVDAERATMRALDAGCTTPLGARAVANSENGTLSMFAVVLSADGRGRIFVAESGEQARAAALGELVARQLLARGAGALLSTHT